MNTTERTRRLVKGCATPCFEVVDRTDEVSSKHGFEVVDKTDEVSPKHGFEVVDKTKLTCFEECKKILVS